MARNVVIGVLVIAVLGLGGFAFLQFQELTELQDTSTQVADNLRTSGTELADSAIATGTQEANNAEETRTFLADSAAETQTQQANNAIATGTQLADRANATATESANRIAIEQSERTAVAYIIATQQIEQTVAAVVYLDAQGTAESENVALVSTLSAVGLDGDGIRDESAQLNDGYRLFATDGYEIILQDGFIGGDFVSGEIDDLEDILEDADLDDVIDQLKDQDNILFFAIDTTLIRGLPRATVSLMRETPSDTNITLVEYTNNALFSLQGDFALIVNDNILINGQPTGRIIIDQQFSDVSVRQAQYIFEDGDDFYVLTYTTPVIEFANLRDAIDTMTASLRLTD